MRAATSWSYDLLMMPIGHSFGDAAFHILSKLDVSTRTAATTYAARNGLAWAAPVDLLRTAIPGRTTE